MGINTESYRFKAHQLLTIASGVITPTQALITVAAESSTADDLDTIALTGFADLTDGADSYRPLVILQADAGDTITVKNGTGNIAPFSGADVALSGDKSMMLIWNGTKWQGLGA